METLAVPGILDSLSSIRQYVNRMSAAAGLDTTAAYKIRLAIDEVATNIITHGYEENGLTGDIVVKSQQTADELIITLEDSAPAYDPRSHKLPTKEDLNKPLEERAIGGLGVYLVLQDMDRFDYRYENGRNMNVFAMRRTG